jgi:hypothetical protein
MIVRRNPRVSNVAYRSGTPFTPDRYCLYVSVHRDLPGRIVYNTADYGFTKHDRTGTKYAEADKREAAERCNIGLHVSDGSPGSPPSEDTAGCFVRATKMRVPLDKSEGVVKT